MNNNKHSRSNNFPANPLKENNQEEDFFLKSEKNRNLFLKFSENARKKIENIAFKFDADNTKKENSKNFDLNEEIGKSKIFGVKEANKNSENNFITNNNLGKNSNSNLVFDYYSKVKNPQSNNFGVANFTENLSKFKSKKSLNNENKASLKLNNNEKATEKIEIQNYNNNNFKAEEPSEKNLSDKNNFFGEMNKFSNLNDQVIKQTELDLMPKQKNSFNGVDNHFLERANNDLPLKLRNDNSIDFFNNVNNNNFINKNFNLVKALENDFIINENHDENPFNNLDAFKEDIFQKPLNLALIKEKAHPNFNDNNNDQEPVEDFNEYIQKCINLNKQANNPFANTNKIIRDKKETIYEDHDNNPNNNFYPPNYPSKPVNANINNNFNNNINYNKFQQNPNFFEDSYYKETEQNYENFTQDFFLERYGHFLPSVLTPTSFNRDISQFLRKDKDDKSEASSRIINIKCEPLPNPSFNLVNKMNQLNNPIEALKINSISNKNENEKNPPYVYSASEKENIEKFDFSKLAQELENAYNRYDFNPFSVSGSRLVIQNGFCDENNEVPVQTPVCFSNISLFKWINAYNKILGNEAFVKEYNLRKFKSINPDMVFEILKNHFASFNKQFSSNNFGNQQLSIFKKNEILNFLFNFFLDFSLAPKVKDSKINLIVKLKVCKFVDSLKIFEAKDFYENDIQIAYILPIDYYEFSNVPNNRRKNPKAGDIIFIGNFSNAHSDEQENVYFLEERDFEIIIQ